MKNQGLRLYDTLVNYGAFGGISAIRTEFYHPHTDSLTHHVGYRQGVYRFLMHTWGGTFGLPTMLFYNTFITPKDIPTVVKYVDTLAWDAQNTAPNQFVDADIVRQRPAIRLALALSYRAGMAPYWAVDLIGLLNRAVERTSGGSNSSFREQVENLRLAIPALEALLATRHVVMPMAGVHQYAQNIVPGLSESLPTSHCLASAINMVEYVVFCASDIQRRVFTESFHAGTCDTTYNPVVRDVQLLVRKAAHTALVNAFDPAYRPAFDFEACVERHLQENE